MNYLTRKPSAILSQYIKGYWELDNYGHFLHPYDYRIVPSGLPEMIFYFGKRPEMKASDDTLESNTIISGHKKGYHDLLISGEFAMFSVLFYPQGLMSFFDIPLTEFYNKQFPLNYIFKEETALLESRLNEAGTFEERIRLIESFLLLRLQKSRKKYEYKRINHSIEIITSTRAKITIEQLASEACLSRKQFERVFSEHIGSSPKQFLKTIRFQSTLAQKATGKERNLTELAYTNGFYDQSHMINDFKSLSGLTPTEFFGVCEPVSDYFLF